MKHFKIITFFLLILAIVAPSKCGRTGRCRQRKRRAQEANLTDEEIWAEEAIESNQKTAVLALDYDGALEALVCKSSRKVYEKLPKIKEMHDKFIALVMDLKSKYDRVIVMNGSTRQQFTSDLESLKRQETQRIVVENEPRINNHLGLPNDDLVFAGFEDDEGYAQQDFQRWAGEMELEFDPFTAFTVLARNSLEIKDKSKIQQVNTQLRHLRESCEGNIDFHFFDDLEHILDALRKAIERNEIQVPADMTLTLWRFDLTPQKILREFYNKSIYCRSYS